MTKYKIAPSILSANFAKLGQEVEDVLKAGADIIHFDVMDNHYVPNLSFGAIVCEALRNHGISAPIDVHLMVSPVDRIISDFAKAGASMITIHPEASNHVHRSIQLIKQHNCLAGLAFNPATSLDYLVELIDELDFILIMSVNPGFGGQKFINSSLNKIKRAKEIIDNRNIKIAVDGGVTSDNIKKIADAGAEIFIAGSYIFNSKNYKQSIDKLRDELYD